MLKRRNLTTTKEQSERLINIGLKKETADCAHLHFYDKKITFKDSDDWVTTYFADWDVMKGNEYSPVWSVLRLEDMLPKEIATAAETYHLIQNEFGIEYQNKDGKFLFRCYADDKIDKLIKCIEILVDNFLLNTEFLNK